MKVTNFVFLLWFGLSTGAILAEDMSRVVKGDETDASSVTWAHAVNSHQALEAELEGPVDFLEADISLGHVLGNEAQSPVPIMAHPPDLISDISFERWLDTVTARQKGKGIKLDFKSIDTVEPSLQILQRHKGKLQLPLWLNADILPGPVKSPTVPVSAQKFLKLCGQYFPNATLSVGWTTYWLPKFGTKNAHYSWDHVVQMTDALKCYDYTSNKALTFPVRAIFASRSISQLQWLLEIFPQSSLTVWSGKFDSLKLDDLVKIRQSFPISRVYYDVPEKIGNPFREKKNEIEVKPLGEPTFDEHSWLKITKNQMGQSHSCSTNTYINRRTVMFRKGSETLVLLKKMLIVTESTALQVQGEVVFFGNDSAATTTERPEVVLALAEVNMFPKNFLTQEDRSENELDVAWDALNSSRLHVFKPEEPTGADNCHFFRLDTSAKKPFQAWIVDCNKLSEDPTAAVNSGTPQISSRNRLILPSRPLILGIISSGRGHVVINDLVVRNVESDNDVSGSNSVTCSKLVLLYILSAFMIVMLILSSDA